MGWVSTYRSRNAVGAPPYWTAAPAIVGTPQDGVASSFTDGTAVGGTSFFTQWFVNGAYVGNGTTYTPITADVGKTLTIDRIAVNAYGTARSSSAGATITAASGGSATDTVEPPFMTAPTLSSGSMTIRWVIPDRLASGVTPIDSPNAITSYTIYYTASSNGPDNARPGGTGVTSSTVSNPTDTSKAISVSAGDYWVSMSTTNAYNEGDYCAPIYVTVP